MREPTNPGKWEVKRERDVLWGGYWWTVRLPSGVAHSHWWLFADAIEIAQDRARNGLRGEGL